MRSDAAQVIALSKSRGRLLSPGSAGSTTSSIADPSPPTTGGGTNATIVQPTPPQPPQLPSTVRSAISNDTSALLSNQAVIVYDERTAL